MFLLVTIVGVVLGYAYAGVVNRRFHLTDARRWLFLAPVWISYPVLLLSADSRDAWVQGVQSFALASFLGTLIHTARAGAPARRASQLRRSEQ